jgi:SAM-dependent methyltransferase
MECHECRLVYTVPGSTPTALLDYYPDGYGPHAAARELRATRSGRGLRRLLTWPYRVRFGEPDWTPRPFGSGRMLDVGCGGGALLGRMAARGWRCLGIDTSATAVERTRLRVPAAQVRRGTLDAVPREPAFDLITVCHALEHMPDPVAAVRTMASLLVPRGKLFVSIPNLDSLEARLFGKCWVGLDVPRHCVHFRRPVFEALLERNGFRVLHARPALFASSISESLILMLPSIVRRRMVGSRAARYLYLVIAPVAIVSYVLGNAGVLEIVAEKREKSNERT